MDHGAVWARLNGLLYHGTMLRYHGAFHLPRTVGEMVVAEAIDLTDARLMIASAREDLAELIESVPLSVHVGTSRT